MLLVTDRHKFSILVNTPNHVHTWSEKHYTPQSKPPFAAQAFYNDDQQWYGATLCRDDGAPASEWFVRATGARGMDPCIGLYTFVPSDSPTFYLRPHKPTSSGNLKPDIHWVVKPVASEASADDSSDTTINQEVTDNFCAPEKAYREFLLGRQIKAENNAVHCHYINPQGNVVYVAMDSENIPQLNFQIPSIKDNTFAWEQASQLLPPKPVIAGFNHSNSNDMKKVPVHLCKYGSRSMRYGQVVKNKEGQSICQTVIPKKEMTRRKPGIQPIGKSLPFDFEILVHTQ